MPVKLLFSSSIKNKINHIFIVWNRLRNACDSLINRRPYKILGIINRHSIYKWEQIKGVSNWVNVTFEGSDIPCRAEHSYFGFNYRTFWAFNLPFQTKIKMNYLLTTKKLIILNFRKDILKWWKLNWNNATI